MSDNNIHMGVIKIHSMEEFDNITQMLTPNQGMIIDFTATWCGPCRMIAPTLDKMAETYPQLMICKADVDELQELTQMFDIKAMPTFVFMRIGRTEYKLEGANKAKLAELCHKFANNEPLN